MALTTNYIAKSSDGTDITGLTDSILFDGGSSVGIGTTSPTGKLTIYDAGWTHILLQNAGHSWGIGVVPSYNDFYIGDYGSTIPFKIEDGASDESLHINSSGNIGIGTDSPSAKLDVRGSVVFNEGSGDYDFRVEGNNDANLLFCDGGNDRVGIGTISPGSKLEVRGRIGIFNSEDSGHNSFISFDSYSQAHGRLLISGSDYLSFGIDLKVDGNTETNKLFVSSINPLNIITTPVFTGTGMNDGETNGTFTGNAGVEVDYRVQIDGTGSPNTFKWSDNGGSSWNATGVSITGSQQALNNGVTFGFYETTGHTSGDYWDFTAKRTLPLNVGDISDSNLMVVDDDGNVGIGTDSPNYKLQVDGAISGLTRSADPTEPSEGEFIIWMSDGTGKGDSGDVLIASKAGGNTRWATLFDHSTGSSW